MPNKSHLIIIVINTQGQMVLIRKKLIFHFEIKSPTLQNYKVGKFKFAPSLALKWYPQVLFGQAKLFHRFAANQNHLSPSHFLFGPQEGAFYRGQFVIWPRTFIIPIYFFIVKNK